MTEDFLYYLWKYKLFEPNQILTSGVPVEIIDPGRQNPDSGPDFFNARIRIDDTLWAGNVEIHLRSSDWIRHHHQKDASYETVILHVVGVHDKPISRKSGEEIPTLQMNSQKQHALYSVYRKLMLNRSWIPCAHLITLPGRIIVQNWLDRMLVERLDRKAAELVKNLTFNKGDWNETFYQSLARNFGFHVNGMPFELLARSLPTYVLGKHKNNLFQLEALLYGQAGMLRGGYRSEYYQNLKKEYGFLARKYKLEPMGAHLWRYLRMRPGNFPTIRIAQFAGLVHRSSYLFSRILETDSLQALTELFRVNASGFWDNHYTFSTRSEKRTKRIGTNAIQLLLINTLIPYLYVYGKMKDSAPHLERAQLFLEQLPGESNNVVRRWESLGIGVRSAYRTQALIELKERYCNRKRCLECAIGNSIIKGVST